MQQRTKVAVIGVAAVAVAGIGTGIGLAATNGDDEAPIPGDARDRAVEAALDHVGGGDVTETEVGDGSAAYEVEIRLDDGSQVEVELDDQFRIIGSAPDDGPGDDDRDGDDD